MKFIHVFILAFNGESPRFANSLKSTIRLFEKMFGNLFWNNVMLEVTRWHFDDRSIKNRKERGESEKKWEQNWNQEFHGSKFDIPVSLKGTYIFNEYQVVIGQVGYPKTRPDPRLFYQYSRITRNFFFS